MTQKFSIDHLKKYLGDRHKLILISLLTIVPLGLLSKSYTGIGQDWVRNYSGDVLYEIFWCLLVFWFVSPIRDLAKLQSISCKIALWVFTVTCGIEISQLWFDLVPETIRFSLIWRLLLGAGFDWWDFFYYALGSLIGYWGIYQIGRIHGKNRN